jgi:hypothetical protein
MTPTERALEACIIWLNNAPVTKQSIDACIDRANNLFMSINNNNLRNHLFELYNIKG